MMLIFALAVTAVFRSVNATFSFLAKKHPSSCTRENATTVAPVSWSVRSKGLSNSRIL